MTRKEFEELREALRIEEYCHNHTTELFKKAEKRVYELEGALEKINGAEG